MHQATGHNGAAAPTFTREERAANTRHEFGQALDQLITTWQGRAFDGDLIAALDGRADRIRREIGARQAAERRKLGHDIEQARGRAVATVAQATSCTVDLVWDILRGERVSAVAEELVAEVLEVAARIKALQPDLQARQRALEARPVQAVECHPSATAAAALGKAIAIIGRRAG